MDLNETLRRERRARLAAERLLEQKQRELIAANQKLALHAASLSEQIVETRHEVAAVRSEADQLKGQNSRFVQDLERAHTAAVMAERRLWDSLEAIGDGFALFDADRCLVAANRAWLDLFQDYDQVAPGITYPEVLTLCAEEGLVDLGEDAPDAWVARMLARWQAPEIAPLELRLFDGRTLRLDDRRARGGDVVSLTLDITETVEREAALREATERAEAANRAKSAFLANMSHEIRTPMNGVVGMADLLCETGLSEEQRLYAETIKSSGEALLAIINDVLDYSKIEAHKLTLHPAPFDLERTIHEVATLLQPSAADKGLDLVVDIDMFLPTRYLGDAGRIRQVLTNLAGNAVKFTEAGHVLIRVVGIEAGADARTLTIVVEDTGIGIAPEHLEHVFGEFNQVEEAANRRYDGTGLGLAITRELVELMGGEVWVESEKGRGSSFGVRLTLPVAEDGAQAPVAAVPLERVLVVDDQLINRTILDRQLRQLGLEVTLCRSGDEALAALAAGRFDAMITDHQMPGMDGLTLAGRVAAEAPGLPVLLLSSNPAGLRGDAAAGVLAAVLQKPVLRSELYRRLAALAPDAPAPPPRPMRVLAAEDNRTNRLVFGRMLKALEIELSFAVNGVEAVAMAAAGRPDIIFMDISMPEMDGREAARAIRAAEAAAGTSRVPIVAMTAHAMPGDAEAILAAGIDHYLTKPLSKAAVVARILAARPPGTRPPCPEPEDTAAPAAADTHAAASSAA